MVEYTMFIVPVRFSSLSRVDDGGKLFWNRGAAASMLRVVLPFVLPFAFSPLSTYIGEGAKLL